MALCRQTRQVVACVMGERSVPPLSAALAVPPGGFLGGPLRHGFLGGLRASGATQSTNGERPRVRGDGTCGKVELDFTATTGAFCAAHIVLLKVP